MASRGPAFAILLGLFLSSLLPGIPSAWLLVRAQTTTGRAISIVGLSATMLLFGLLWSQWHPSHRNAWVRVDATLVSIFVLASIYALSRAPTGRPAQGSPVSQHYTGGGSFQRFVIANLVPEIEQVNLGFVVTPYLLPIFSRERLDNVLPVTMEIYREMESDPNFRQLGSAMGGVYAEFLGQPFDAGHYYLYIPNNRRPGAIPAILFLHGSMGNFKAYTWAWSKIAEETGYAIIAPSYGFGNWGRTGGVQAAVRALDDAIQTAQIDREQVYLAGLSNGGLGVSLAAGEWPNRFKGLIFISPVMATEVVDGPGFQSAWRGRPCLVITGEADRNIPVGNIRQRVDHLSNGGVRVTLVTYPGEDHFLFFTQREDVSTRIVDWVAGN